MASLNVNNIFIFAIETSPQSFMVQPSNKGIKDNIDSMMLSEVPQISVGDQWSEKKGANELSKKLKPNFIQAIMNFEIFKTALCKDEEPEAFFPRMVYLKLDESLI